DSRITSSELAFRVKGLLEPTAEDRRPVLNINEPSPVVVSGRLDQRTRTFTPEQSLFFRVVAVKPSGPPESLDAVRDKVVADWKLKKAFALAGEQANALAAKAREVGLREAVASATELKQMLTKTPAEAPTTQPAEPDPITKNNLDILEPTTPTRFTRSSQQVRGVGYAPVLAEAVFGLGDPTALSAAERILCTALPRSQAWVVTEVTSLDPLYAGEFEKQRPNLDMGRMQDLRIVQGLWFNSENIRLRTGWQQYEGPGR
ncbi:MAG: hypothetical protein JXO22_16530, partial [Phycisphaerae bacterium]|nr:hypothetical protein [Phycisphaerae bacterium]